MNTTSLNTWLGAVQAAGTAILSYYITQNEDGSIDWHDPVLYIGGLVAVAMAVKAYFTQGTPPAGTVVVTKPEPAPPAPAQP